MTNGTNGTNGGVMLRWMHLGLILTVQILMLGAVYGSLSFQVADHTRRIDLIEKRMEERILQREEYERRHEDMQKQIDMLREEVKSLREWDGYDGQRKRRN